jgi:addiction module HigA family antidote
MASNFAFPPAHPGEYLREEVLPHLGMSKRAFGDHLGISRTTLYAVLNEKQAIERKLACRLGQALGDGARFWLALQMQYDIWHAERDQATKVAPLHWDNAGAA